MRKVSAKKFKLIGLAIFILAAFLIVGLGRGGFFNKSAPARSPDPPQKEISKPSPDQNNNNNNSIDLVRPPFLDE
jgi:hypothetical protein